LDGRGQVNKKFVIGTAVFAISGKKLDSKEVKRRWEDAPVVSLRGTPKRDHFFEFRNLGTGVNLAANLKVGLWCKYTLWLLPPSF